jgi:hypothetical protein
MPTFFYIHFILLLSFVSHGQEVADTSSFKLQDPVSLYYSSLGEQSPLYNGKEYLDYAGTIKVGHQFFSTKDFVNGSILFDGMLFEDVMILYDIVKDKVVLRHHNKYFKIDLPVEKIAEFKIRDHHFVHLISDSAKVIAEGFYDKLFNGKIDLYVKRTKVIREELTRNDLTTIADEKNTYYIKKQGVYYVVKNMRGLLRILNDRREVVRQYLRSKRIRYKDDKEAAILMALKYYDSLSN